MLIPYKKYPWINSSTGKEPVTGDEFLYVFYTHKDEPSKTFLCMKPSIHPIKKHPLGFFGFVSWILYMFFSGEVNEDISTLLVVITALSIITGSIISFGNYTNYYFKERKWKQKVIHDWKSNKLRYKYSESILSDFTFKLGGSPIDESVFF